ncbi:MAG: hypothetical protein ACI8YI_001763 [Paracoccaceae bacterium]|jgi:hypothetical protein
MHYKSGLCKFSQETTNSRPVFRILTVCGLSIKRFGTTGGLKLHGLVNRSIQRFVQESYGDEYWADICRRAELGFEIFEAMLIYDNSQTNAVLTAACDLLDRSRTGLLEDMGTFLVSHPDFGALRRLLRFGGETFEEFLHSLDDLHDRANLALPELDFPDLELREYSANSFSLQFSWEQRGFGTLVLGILRAMADNYGVLVLMEHSSSPGDEGDYDRISINLLDTDFSESRDFALGGVH